MIRKMIFAIFTFCCLAAFLGVWWYNDRPAFLYPALPFQTVEKHVVVSKLKKASDQLILLGADDDEKYVWVGTQTNRGGRHAAEELKSVMERAGWSFYTQEGAGYFYQQGTEQIVVTSKMWSRDFILFKIPAQLQTMFTLEP